MQLPSDLQHFPHPALLVAADRVHAKLFLIHDGQVDHVTDLSHPHDRKSDNETSFVNVDTGAGSSPEPSDDDRFSAYVRELAHQVKKTFAEHGAQNIRLVMEAELAHRLKKALGAEASHVLREAHVDAMKEDVVNLVKRIV